MQQQAQVIDFVSRKREAEYLAKKKEWITSEERLRFMIQGHPDEGLYLNMLEEYGPSMAPMLEEQFKLILKKA